MQNQQRRVWGAVVASMLAMTVGCGPPDHYACRGVATHDGTPVGSLQITFEPVILDSTRPPMCLSKPDGTFEVKHGRELGIPPGSYKIFIEDPAAADGLQTSTEPAYLYVIDRYSPLKSDLTYEADQHRTDFELKLDTKEYTGPAVKDPNVIENTTDNAEKKQ
jgi:hypothetical protein